MPPARWGKDQGLTNRDNARKEQQRLLQEKKQAVATAIQNKKKRGRNRGRDDSEESRNPVNKKE
jgi:hypothetical protein